MSSSSTQPAKGQISEAKVLIIVLIIGFLAVIGFRYHLASSMPKGDPRFIKRKATADELPSMEGNVLVAPPL